MELYEILLVIGTIFFILGIIPIFGSFINILFDMIIDIKNHNYDSLPELFLGIGIIFVLISMIFLIIDRIK